MDHYTVGLLTVGLNQGNMGCNALCLSAISLLEEVAESLGCSFSYIDFFDAASEVLEYIYPDLSGMDIRFAPPTPRYLQRAKRIVMGKSRDVRVFKQAVDACDVFFECPGDLLGDLYGPRPLKVMRSFHSIIRGKGKPVVFLPHTVGPFLSKKAQEVASTLLTNAAHVFTRDSVSYEKARECVATEKVSSTIDMAMFMPFQRRERAVDVPQVGVNPSGLLWNGGFSGDNQFGLKVDYRKLISRVIEALHAKGSRVVLLGHVVSGPRYYLEDDYKVCRLLRHRYPYCEVAPFFYHPVEAKTYISGLNLLVASRLHCCIGGYSAGVPIYPLAYSRKFTGLFVKELKYPYGADLGAVDEETAVNGVVDMVNNLPSIQAEMTERTRTIAEYKARFLGDLSRVISALLR